MRFFAIEFLPLSTIEYTNPDTNHIPRYKGCTKKAPESDYKNKIQKIYNRMICSEFIHIAPPFQTKNCGDYKITTAEFFCE